MRATLTIMVTVCFFALASSQNCTERSTELTSCISELAAATPNNTKAFCNDCENPLVA